MLSATWQFGPCEAFQQPGLGETRLHGCATHWSQLGKDIIVVGPQFCFSVCAAQMVFFQALGNIGFVASFDETPWFLESSLKWFLSDASMRRWTFRTSDRSSSGADLSGTAWQNIWKHRETLHFYMLLGAWVFSWWKRNDFCLQLLSSRTMFFEISTAWSASSALEHSMVLPVTLYELFCQVAISKVSFAPKERLAKASR